MIDGVSILISEKPLSIDPCYSYVHDVGCGGINLFIGTVRQYNRDHEVTHLEFDIYESMASKELEKIGRTCIDMFDIKKIAIHHRKGKVEVAGIAVIIAVSSMHRDAAFKACRYALDTLKETIPIWKKEYLKDGSYWVNSHP